MKPVTTLFAVGLAAVLMSFTYKGYCQPQPDRDFAVKAAQANIAEVQAGQLAIKQGSTDAVRSFGQMMVNDHAKALNELDSIVRKNNWEALPAVADAEHQGLAQKLQALNGKSFDDAYIQSQLKDHRTAIALFEGQVSGGKQPALKLYASTTLPHLRMHLEHAQTLASGSH